MHGSLSTQSAETFARLLGKARLKHLQLVVHIAELESLQKAATRIGLSQPAVTQALGEFEQMAGTQLFERHAKGMRLSPAGLTFIPMIRAALKQLQAFADTAMSLQTGSRAVIRVGSIGAGVCGLLAQALPAFSRAHPDVAVEVLDVSAHDLIRSLEHDMMDLLVCREPAVLPPGRVFHPVLDDRYVVVGKRTHPVFATPRASVDDFEAATWITPPTRSIAASRFSEFCSTFKAPPKVCRIASHSLLVTQAMLNSRDLLALMPYRLTLPLLAAGTMAVLDVDHAELAPLGVVADVEPDALTALLVDFFRAFPYPA